MQLHHILFLAVTAILLKNLLNGASLCLRFYENEEYCINLTYSPPVTDNMSSTVEIYYEPSGCNCDGTSYSKSAINAAAQKALELASQGQTLGKDKYPHVYNDYEHFNFSHASKPYLEFPVEEDGKPAYDGGSPGADRIVIGSIAEDYSSAVYCAVITHDGSSHNGFTECADDTLNPRGKGNYESHERKGHHHRRLVQRIDLK